MTAPTPPASPYSGEQVLHRISAATADLDQVTELPLAAAAARFDALHVELQTALADLDQG